MTTKNCIKCLADKPISEFYRHPKMKDGHLNQCKECTKQYSVAHRQKNLEHHRAHDRLRASNPERIVLRRKTVENYIRLFPHRRKANVAVGNAVRDGRLVKQPCWVCGSKAVAHHPDYDRPLDVVWLCQPHHKQTHALVEQS